MPTPNPYKAFKIMGLGWPLAVAVNFGGVQVMHRQKGYTNDRPVYRSAGASNYFTVQSDGTNWIAVRYVSGSPTAPQVGPLDTEPPIGTFGALTIYVP